MNQSVVVLNQCSFDAYKLVVRMKPFGDDQSKTKNRLMVTVHSKDVPEILPLYRMTKTDFPPHFLDRLMHSFPMMYNTMG